MKRLWAPWRMKYIEGTAEADGCFLCKAAEAGVADGEGLVVWRESLTVCVMNRYPYNNGHLLVAPCRHEGEIGSLSEEERAALFGGLVRARDVLQKVMSPDGFNIGINLAKAAGAGLEDHLHFHVVPRWNGDTNFMPVLADTKVIPESLSDLCGKLKYALEG